MVKVCKLLHMQKLFHTYAVWRECFQGRVRPTQHFSNQIRVSPLKGRASRRLRFEDTERIMSWAHGQY